MQLRLETFASDELVELSLRALFERHGFALVKTARFEEYALYVENKNFLDTERTITFMNPDGRLMALKPDVTLSIVKNIPGKPTAATQKLYYIDDVYRLSRENREYKVRKQIGVELIGESDAYANLEIIGLALESLGAISEHFALDLSHLGFITGLFGALSLSHRAEQHLIELIHAKNASDIARLLEGENVSQEKTDLVTSLTSIHGPLAESLPLARSLVRNKEMQAACDELAQVEAMLNGSGRAVNLDFSVVNDLDYYNGLIFRGYVEGVPSLVLTGGRYDNLLRRMGKQSYAVGFAVSLDELGTYLKKNRSYDFDLLITYPQECDFPRLLALAAQEREKGLSVRLEREGADLRGAGLRFSRHCRYADGLLEEVAGQC